MPKDRARTLTDALQAILEGNATRARAELREHYPFQRLQRNSRSWSPKQALQLFLRDGFVDRYSGGQLIFPGALRVLSLVVPDEFPSHPNWKMDETHIAFWELFPTIDHVVPVARGGKDEPHNWVTTSMMRNQAKSNWTLEELGWKLHAVGNLDEWDGLLGLTQRICAELPHLEPIRKPLQPGR